MKGLKQIDDFIITKELSKEKEIILYEAVNKKTNAIVVIKAFPTTLFKDKRKLDFFKSELKLISGFDHPNISKFYSLKKTEKFYYLIMEYCNGGKLSAYKDYYEITNKCPLKEEMVQTIVKDILCGLSYMHNCNTIHRNLNLENIELNFNSISNKVKQNQNPKSIDYSKVSLLDCTVKISNLSFARELDENGVASTVVGSPIFMAPDIIINALQPQKKEFYNTNADLWSLGAISYELLVGKPPFDGDDITAVSKKLDDGSYFIPLDLHLSIEAITFIDGLIQYSQDNRLRWDELVNHPFIKSSIEQFHYLDSVSLKADGFIKELKLNIKQNNDKYIWSKEVKNNQLKQNENIKTKGTNMEEQDKIAKEIQRKKKSLEKEIQNVEKEKQQIEQKLLKAEKEKREAEELKQRIELEKTRLINYEKNQREIIEENNRKEQEHKQKEKKLRQQEIDKLNKEKARIEEEKKTTEKMKREAELILKNAEKIKQEAEEQKKEIVKQKEQENKKKREEAEMRQLEDQFKDISKTKLIQELKQKDDHHNLEIAQLQKNLLALKTLSNELKAEAIEKKKMQVIFEEKEKEHKRLLLQIEQITNEKEKKLLQIEKETQEKELQIIQEKQRREKEELQRKENELQKNIGSTKERLQQMGIINEQIEISVNCINNANNDTVITNFNDEWECYSTKSIEFNETNPDISDYVVVNDYISSKTNI